MLLILQQLLSEPERSAIFVFVLALGVFMGYKLTELHLEPKQTFIPAVSCVQQLRWKMLGSS